MAAAYKIITLEGIDNSAGKNVQVAKIVVYVADDSPGTDGFQIQQVATDITELQNLLTQDELDKLAAGGAVAIAVDTR